MTAGIYKAAQEPGTTAPESQTRKYVELPPATSLGTENGRHSAEMNPSTSFIELPTATRIPKIRRAVQVQVVRNRQDFCRRIPLGALGPGRSHHNAS